ncbi:anthranilate synthase component I [Anaerostipes sp.]|uniref:anthranilate synthase component I n=1 Tax=Anaerostipes sp. TaxID=1872530 RepID=UPI002E77E1EF|nr:anthranilate synthase component I [Anaerostipes sp.]MED9813702.1 anthranilate synthase component I [Anaerostipes sp.]
MLYPTLNEVEELLKDYQMVPVFYEVLADYMTPIRMFQALRKQGTPCFMLESVENKDQWGRYSFIGINPRSEIKISGKELEVNGVKQKEEFQMRYLSDLIEKYKSPVMEDYPKLTGGLIGYFGYDMIRQVEKKLTNVPEDDLNMPECHLCMYDEIIAFDHLANKAVIIQNIHKGDNIKQKYEELEDKAELILHKMERPVSLSKDRFTPAKAKVVSNLTKEQYEANVKKAKEYIKNGDIFQVVLSQRFEIDTDVDPFDVYRCLRTSNPSPYLYFFDFSDYQVVGASPEKLVSVLNGIVATKPIAGTVPRGKTKEEDDMLVRQLVNDPKERAEHTMLVDLGRNDVGKVSKFGTVEVKNFMTVEKYSKVTHLVSDVQGELRDDENQINALMSVLPAGTLSGAPKVRAMEIIDELENKKRGVYGGTVGYLGFDGNIDTCIAIRTVVFKDGKGYVQAGAGIVNDSVPEKEFMETKNKALAVVNAVKEAAKL